jgi:hypothetical protein
MMGEGSTEEAGARSVAALPGLWTPSDLSERDFLALYRAWLVSLPLGAASLLFVLIAIAAELLHHGFLSGRAVMLLVVVALLPSILRRALFLLLANRRGFFTRKGMPVSRAEQPRRYWRSMAAHSLAEAVSVAAAVYLLWVSLTIC